MFPQFATHNALTVASVIEDAGGVDGFRVSAPARHGRSALRGAARRTAPGRLPHLCAGWGHRDLLAYLVRRLLENGANSSFVSVAADPSVPIEQILRRPRSRIGAPAMRAIRTFRCHAICMRLSAAIRPASSLATVRVSTRSSPRCAPVPAHHHGCAADRRRRVRRAGASRALAHRWPPCRRRARSRCDDCGGRHGGGPIGLFGLGEDAGRRTRGHARARSRAARGASRRTSRFVADRRRQDPRRCARRVA